MNLLIVVAATVLGIAVHLFNSAGWALTPDGQRYMALAMHTPLPRPFAGRWVLPRIIGTKIRDWIIVSYVAIVLANLTLYAWLQPQVGDNEALLGSLLFIGLMGLVGFPTRAPVLLDPTALLFALVGAFAIQRGGWWILLAAVAVGLGSMLSERVGPYTALFSWTLWPLVGLLISAVIHYTAPEGDDILDEQNAAILKHPFKAGIVYHKGRMFDPFLMLTPWGACLAALAGTMTTQFWVTVAVSYAMVLVATDTVRLYQWAAPVVILVAVPVLGPLALAPVLAVHYLNPWRGDGV